MSKKSILIAEDDMFLLRTLASTLQENDIEVFTAKNGQEAIEAIKQHEPNLILLDLLMPQVDGFGVLEFIQKNNISSVAVMLSNVSDDINMEKCKELGCKDYFVKSNLDEDQVWDKIKKYL